MEIIFWICAAGIVYAYAGYPLVLYAIEKVWRASESPTRAEMAGWPSLSLIIPAHNEALVIGRKLENTLSLRYPGALQIVVVSDGSTDATPEIVESFASDDRLTFIDLAQRKGKANALNRGVQASTGEIVVFTDASILLDGDALAEIVVPFAESSIGCVSGEDLIEGGGGEGLYGRYELFLRRQESKIGSIVGASGSFYAQRRSLVSEFPEGVAPDFLSVLNTVSRGFRAVSTPRAFGHMSAAKETKNEFKRKVRTVVRGMTALFERKSLLNPVRFPSFAFFLLSHKLARWYVPFFLLLLLSSSLLLSSVPIYAVAAGAQVVFYLVALLALVLPGWLRSTVLGKIALYFTIVNAAILIAWFSYFGGARPEVWNPTKRDA